MRETTLPLSHFETVYARGEDPWRYATSAYERDKYAASIAALPRAHYQQGLEIGCSIGVLTSLLAERCRRLMAVEPVAAALAAARSRNAGHAHVTFADTFVPAEWPTGTFDLIVLSEVLDYLGAADLQRLSERIEGTLSPHGHLLLVHWVGKKKQASGNGLEASDWLIGDLRACCETLKQDRNPDYRLDLLQRQR